MNKIGFIGGGKMATAIIKGIINSKWCAPSEIIVSDKNEDALKALKENYGVSTTIDNIEVVKNSKIILFAVKPFVLRDVLNQIKDSVSKDTLFLSIVAGMAIKTIQEVLGNVTLIRIMPNTPALVNEGMSALCPAENVSAEQVEVAKTIFEKVGKVIVSDEKYIDIITAISGSGPAFYYYIIDEIAKAGEKLGLDYQTCLKLSAQTAMGASKMIMETGVSPEQLIINVTTPGGCTAVGNEVLKENKTCDILFDTIKKTAQKAFELGKN